MLDGMWTSRVTSHISLAEVPAAITEARIVQATALLYRTMRRAGIPSPRIAVAALNPHAGDGGNFGREELDVLAPAIRALEREGIGVEGPLPSDTVFLKLVAGTVDGVVTMYHDQGQIALKLLGFDRGVTLQGGLPIPVCTPAHGTAFDIAGKGCASAGAMVSALRLLSDLRAMLRSCD